MSSSGRPVRVGIKACADGEEEDGGTKRRRGSLPPESEKVPAGVLHKKYKRVPLEPLENGVPVPAPDDVESFVDEYELGPDHPMVVIGKAITALIKTKAGEQAWQDIWRGKEAKNLIEVLKQARGDAGTEVTTEPAALLHAFLNDHTGPTIASLLPQQQQHGFRAAWDPNLFALARPHEARWPDFNSTVTLVVGLCDQREQSLSVWSSVDVERCYTIRCLEAIEALAKQEERRTMAEEEGEEEEETERQRREWGGFFFINVNAGRCAQVEIPRSQQQLHDEEEEGEGGGVARRCMACKLPPGALVLSRALRSLVFAMLHAMGVKLRHACAITTSDDLGPLSLEDRPSLPGAAALVKGVSEATTIHPSKVRDLVHRFHSKPFTSAGLAHLISSLVPSLAEDITLGEIIQCMKKRAGLPKVCNGLTGFDRIMMERSIACIGLEQLDLDAMLSRDEPGEMMDALGQEELAELLMDGAEECGADTQQLLAQVRAGASLPPSWSGRKIIGQLLSLTRELWEDQEDEDEDDNVCRWQEARDLAEEELEAMHGVPSAAHGWLLGSFKIDFMHYRRQRQAKLRGDPLPCLAFGTLKTGVVLLETWTRGQDDGEDPKNPLRRTATGSASQTFAFHGACWASPESADSDEEGMTVKETARLYTSLPRVEAALEDKLVLTLYNTNDGGGTTGNGHKCPSYEACLESFEWLLGEVLLDPEIRPYVQHVVYCGQPPVKIPKQQPALNPLCFWADQSGVLDISEVHGIVEAGWRVSGGIVAPELTCHRLLVRMDEYEEWPAIFFFWSRGGGKGLVQGSSVASLGKDVDKMPVLREMPASLLLHRYVGPELVVRNLLEVLAGMDPSWICDLPLPEYWHEPLAVIRSSVGIAGGIAGGAESGRRLQIYRGDPGYEDDVLDSDEEGAVERRLNGNSRGGAQGIDVANGSGAYAKLDNLFGEFEYQLKDQPTKVLTARCKYEPTKGSIDVNKLLQTPVEAVALGYFRAKAGMFVRPKGSRHTPTLKAIDPQTYPETSIMSSLVGVRWYVPPK